MEEVIVKLERILCKTFKNFSVSEKALVVDLYVDKMRGRYSPIFSATKERLEAFFDYVYKNEKESYSNLPDPTRWVLEDVFFERV